ncbi:MAG: UDP-N-acetylglucosamine 1-carboxyvinyltransferase [Clostridium sp.]|nr:UDP-N-acetylglucosamine 1-carboxyvinyltransferase [Acetatifactor muris]MCM1526082.1 UDP-N-acetylglucosamine 1-carboxyvinyltransferase [Bacteroides sp.]MCM1562158.1 UDP-N-acetylglucosamine 1-carboxyvinyltransferase [Clostridium sp.]
MTTLHVHGGIPLQGKVRIQGSKNAALPILAATLLTGETSRIRNCPKIADVQHMVSLLRSLGCRVSRTEEGYLIDSAGAGACNMSGEAITGMRSSLCMLGAMLGRFGEVTMEHPGGCVIGKRPIDLHLQGLEQMGVSFSEEEGRLTGRIPKELHGAQIRLLVSSVGATENILLAAVQAVGDTVITGAAMEPEVQALCRYLMACGARIEGVGSSVLRIRGGGGLHGADFAIPADRIVAGTYLFACVGCGGSVFLENAPCDELESVVQVAELMGAKCQPDCEAGLYGADYGHERGLYVQSSKRPKAMARLRTAVYPGFPTDLQSMALTVLTKADGRSSVEETIFENRFRVVESLRRMGADIELQNPNVAFVRGVPKLYGAKVEACELRGGAALVLAGLMAEGETTVTGCAYIERGYENIGKDLRDLGARIVSV